MPLPEGQSQRHGEIEDVMNLNQQWFGIYTASKARAFFST